MFGQFVTAGGAGSTSVSHADEVSNQLASEPVGVAVHSSDPLFALGAATLVNANTALEVRTGQDEVHADLLMAVTHVVDDDTLDWLREARRRSERETPPAAVLVTGTLTSSDVLAVLDNGVVAVLPLKDLDTSRLGKTLLAVHDGSGFLPPRTLGHLLNHLQHLQQRTLSPQDLTLTGFTTRELDVLRLVADGLDSQEIAAGTGCSVRTVKSIIIGLRQRHGFNSRVDAVAYAIRIGAI